MVHLDVDLRDLSVEDLRAEVQRLRNGIRSHRDERGHNRCWVDDVTLYALLSEKKGAEFKLPPRDEFLGNCGRYWESRQRPETCTRRSGLVRRLGFLIAKATGVI